MHLIYRLAHKLLLHLPSEQAHAIGKWAMQHHLGASGRFAIQESKTTLFGIQIDNPLGIAAGFDKNAELISHAEEYGFGFIEIGSVTYEGGPENKKPRLFRLREEESLLNRRGLNGYPAEIVAERLNGVGHQRYGINIAKTNNRNITGKAAIQDIVNSYALLKNFGMYTVLNISCPNTSEKKTFEEPESLNALLSAVLSEGKGGPLLIKLSPNLSQQRLESLVSIAEPIVDGYECVNTLPSSEIPEIAQQYIKGGISGKLLQPYMLDTLFLLRKLTQKPILAVGGINSGDAIFAAAIRGANAFLAYTGFIYGGLEFAPRVLSSYYSISSAHSNFSFMKKAQKRIFHASADD